MISRSVTLTASFVSGRPARKTTLTKASGFRPVLDLTTLSSGLLDFDEVLLFCVVSQLRRAMLFNHS